DQMEFFDGRFQKLRIVQLQFQFAEHRISQVDRYRLLLHWRSHAALRSGNCRRGRAIRWRGAIGQRKLGWRDQRFFRLLATFLLWLRRWWHRARTWLVK